MDVGFHSGQSFMAVSNQEKSDQLKTSEAQPDKQVFPQLYSVSFLKPRK